MTPDALRAMYRDYIACLNARDWTALDRFVDRDVRHNARPLGLAGYRTMLEQNVSDIPDLRFEITLLTVEPPHIASRLRFDCTPVGEFLGLPVNGSRIKFHENVFYKLASRRIARVWSIIDKPAIEAQL